MYLPRSRAPVTLVTANEPAGQPQDQGETVLIVEDNPDVKTVAIALLEQLNYRTIAVENAEAALSFLSNGAPVDLVFSDVMLPGDACRPSQGADPAQALSSCRPYASGPVDASFARNKQRLESKRKPRLAPGFLFRIPAHGQG